MYNVYIMNSTSPAGDNQATRRRIRTCYSIVHCDRCNEESHAGAIATAERLSHQEPCMRGIGQEGRTSAVSEQRRKSPTSLHLGHVLPAPGHTAGAQICKANVCLT